MTNGRDATYNEQEHAMNRDLADAVIASVRADADAQQRKMHAAQVARVRAALCSGYRLREGSQELRRAAADPLSTAANGR